MPELPGGGATAEINSVAFSRIHWKHFDKVGEYKGVKLLGVFTHGPGQMFNSKRADHQGRRSRRHEDPHRRRHRRGNGRARSAPRRSSSRRRNPMSCSAPASPTARSSRSSSIQSFKLGSVVKHATLFPGGFYSSSFGFFMNEDKCNKLSKEDQDAIMSVSGENIARIAGKVWDKYDAAPLEELKKTEAYTIIRASPELVKGVQEKTKAIVDEVDRRCRKPRASTARKRSRGVPAKRSRMSRPASEPTAMPESRAHWGTRLDRVLGFSPRLSFCSALMLLTAVDVVSRYIFNWPLRGAFELTELGLLVLIFAGLPLASRRGEHVTLDFIDQVARASAAPIFGAASIEILRRPGVCRPRLAGLDQGRQDRRPAATLPMCCACSVGPFVYLMAAMVAITGDHPSRTRRSCARSRSRPRS